MATAAKASERKWRLLVNHCWYINHSILCSFLSQENLFLACLPACLLAAAVVVSSTLRSLHSNTHTHTGRKEMKEIFFVFRHSACLLCCSPSHLISDGSSSSKKKKEKEKVEWKFSVLNNSCSIFLCVTSVIVRLARDARQRDS